MANNYMQFSEIIQALSEEEAAWVNQVCGLDASRDEDLQKICRLLGLDENTYGAEALQAWPDFGCDVEVRQPGPNDLWLYSEEYANIDHLIWFVQAFLRKFRPNMVFTCSGADTCSKLRVGEFGGWWVAISANEMQSGSTYAAAKLAAAKLQKRLKV